MRIRVAVLLVLLPLLSRSQEADTIAFTLSEFNNILVDVVLNQKDTLRLKFDSGTTGLLLTHEAIADKTSLMDEEEGETTSDYQALINTARLDIGSWYWDSLEVYPVSLSGQGSDGRFGWDLFRNCILEIDYDASLMIVHSSLPSKTSFFSKFHISSAESLFSIEGNLRLANRNYLGQFLFDTGYQKALLLDSALLTAPALPDSLPVLKTSVLLNGAGKRFVTQVVHCEQLAFGETELVLDSIPAQLLTAQNPAGFPIHILGNELLCRMNVIFDFPSGQLYLRKNTYFERPYSY